MTAHTRPARALATVDLDAIRRNVALLSSRAAGSGAETMAIVKADGYGHGAEQVARAALRGGATWLGACSMAEAVALREAGIDAPLFSWLEAVDTDFTPALEADIDVSVSSVAELARVADAAASTGRRARVHLKIDTGLSRNGCPAELWPALVKSAAGEPGIDVVAVWSHLAAADEPGHPSIDRQAQRFADAYALAREAGLNPLRHLANSAATLTRPDLHFDLVRPGIAIYGLNPVPQQEQLTPAMTFSSHVVLTKRIAAGESVSYGLTWTADRDTTVALVPVGYADGVPRTLSGRMDVWLGGRRRPVVGRVCMDQVVVDCGDDEPQVGTDVVLFGTGSEGGPTAREWADKIGTIDYEIVTGMYRPRVQRAYTGADS
ncbi:MULTISPECIES: alanine racemase [Prauserella salsuginis group]|uniref:Alanine racemase n=2 Tax=Prauserella salsuginis group TaxID=2893672 RepID=A0A839XQ96_9PSEU|nr:MULTISPECIES: alanine racemase [Prauserella salsuginis group]MBB3662095.1 alanine racemase [Prauserella sediminis]MCR3719787.1 alanine racemase [Prauserella flava]MCR3736670.1 alanine racemase [Prauserella salsuginis]